jgi:hypothetical protein
MRHTKPLATRNKIDVADASQIRILKKRLGISSDDLHRVVAKVGNSIAAVTKEIESQKPLPLTAPAPVENDFALPSPVGVTASVQAHERARCFTSPRRGEVGHHGFFPPSTSPPDITPLVICRMCSPALVNWLRKNSD